MEGKNRAQRIDGRSHNRLNTRLSLLAQVAQSVEQRI